MMRKPSKPIDIKSKSLKKGTSIKPSLPVSHFYFKYDYECRIFFFSIESDSFKNSTKNQIVYGDASAKH